LCAEIAFEFSRLTVANVLADKLLDPLEDFSIDIILRNATQLELTFGDEQRVIATLEEMQFASATISRRTFASRCSGHSESRVP
jgi:hypothetical protein